MGLEFFVSDLAIWLEREVGLPKKKKKKKKYIRDVNTASPNLRLTFSSSNTTCSAGT